MSQPPVLRPEEVAGVLSGDADGAPALPGAAPDGGPAPYSLRQPVAIPPSSEAEARETLERLVETLAPALGAVEDSGVEISLDGMQQQRVDAALSALPAPTWIACLGRPGAGGLALALNSTVAVSLVDIALGGQGQLPEEGREPTPVEARVLKRLIEDRAEGLGALVGTSLTVSSVHVGSLPETVAAPGETVGVGLMRFRIGESDHTSLLLATASLLLPSSRAAARDSSGPGPLAPALEQLELPFRPVLEAGSVSFKDVLELRPGNVLRLDAPRDSSFELRVEGHAVATGRIVREEDRVVFAVEARVGRDEPKENA